MSAEQRTLEDLQREIDELGATLDARLDEVEQRTGTAGLGLRQRMRKLEAQLAAPATEPEPGQGAAFREGIKTFIDYTTKILSASTPVAVLLVGLFITDTVEQALEERKVELQESRLDLDATRAMEHLLERLRQPNIGEEDARSTALLVAGYGVHAILPLVMELDLEPGKFTRIAAAKHALRSMALAEDSRRDLCTTLVGLLRFSKDGVFFERTGLRHSIDLAGTLRCPEAGIALAALPKDDPELAKAIEAAMNALKR